MSSKEECVRNIVAGFDTPESTADLMKNVQESHDSGYAFGQGVRHGKELLAKEIREALQADFETSSAGAKTK